LGWIENRTVRGSRTKRGRTFGRNDDRSGEKEIEILLCDATKKKLHFSADRFRWVFMTKDNKVVFNKDFYLLYSTK
jgi:hypothetical protein